MTPHNTAKKEEIESTVLMPGDPLRAQYIAENFLENSKLVNKVRGMYAYTGEYKGKQITVMAHGMGNPSIGIYSYELFKFYDVDTIIRIGSCGAYSKDLNLKDVILVDKAYSESTFAETFNGSKEHEISGSKITNNLLKKTAEEMNIELIEGNVHSTDVFYSDITDIDNLLNNHKCVAVEMESFALFSIAKELKKNASCILTVTDSLVKEGLLTPEERQTSLNNMILLGLEAAIRA